MFVPVLGIVIEGDIFSLLLEQELSCRRDTYGEGGLPDKLMGELSRLKHGHGMVASCLRESSVEREWGSTGLPAGLVGEHQQLVLDLRFVLGERNVGGFRRRGFQSRLLGGLA